MQSHVTLSCDSVSFSVSSQVPAIESFPPIWLPGLALKESFLFHFIIFYFVMFDYLLNG